MRLAGKVALITGAGSGIGQATAELFAKEGAKVAVADIKREGGEVTVKAIQDAGGRAIFIEANVAKVTDCERMVAETVGAFGGLDVLFNNAGIGVIKTTEETGEDDWDRVLDINLKGIFFGTKAAVPHMVRAGGGSIISTASVLAFQGMGISVAYAASKGGIVGMTVAMAKDLARYHIRVNCICPGTVETPLLSAFLAGQPDLEGPRNALLGIHPLGRLGRPLDVAQAALWLAGDESTWVTGVAVPVDGGFLTNQAADDAHAWAHQAVSDDCTRGGRYNLVGHPKP